MRVNARLLIVDDDAALLDLLETDLTRRGFEVRTCRRADEAAKRMVEFECDAVLTDLNMPGMSGVELCRKIAETRRDVPVVVITAFGSMDAAVSAIRAGAYDFVTKPIELDLLTLVLERAVKHRRLGAQVRLLEERLDRADTFERLIGESDAMRTLFDRIARIANSDASVLITGESGTGKELIARALHERSARKSGPFIAVNCAAVPETLLESELFGHVRGAFTDAKKARKGLLQEAHGGTLLLDEIGDLPLGLQPKLLRVLEERCVRPLGETQSVPIDIRLLASTHQDIEAAVEEGRFRQDLFFRINVIQLEAPPLRERGGDILLLAQRFLQEFAARARKEIERLSESFAERLLAYPWPGNVRELRNAMERAVALTRLNELTIDDLPDRIREHKPTTMPVWGEGAESLISMDALERRYIVHVLHAAGGNKTRAARILSFDRKTMYRKLEHFGITESEFSL